MEGEILNSFGYVYRGQGKHEDALEMSRKAQRIFRKTLGPDGTEVGNTIVCTAAVLKAQGKLAEAIDKYEESLNVLRRAHGPEHPEVARILYLMALCKEEIGDVAGAVACLREAQGINRSGGESHVPAEKVDALLAELEGGL